MPTGPLKKLRAEICKHGIPDMKRPFSVVFYLTNTDFQQCSAFGNRLLCEREEVILRKPATEGNLVRDKEEI